MAIAPIVTMAALALPPTHATPRAPINQSAPAPTLPAKYSSSTKDKANNHTVVMAWEGESKFSSVP